MKKTLFAFLVFVMLFLTVASVSAIITPAAGNLNGLNKYTIFNYKSVVVKNITTQNINDMFYVLPGNMTDFMRALNNVTQGHSTIYLPCGTYLTNSSIDTSATIRGLDIIGGGTYCTYIKADSGFTGDYLFKINKDYTHISGMTFHGNQKVNTTLFFKSRESQFSRLDNVKFQDFLIYGVFVDNETNNLMFTNPYFYQTNTRNDTVCIYYQWNANENTIYGGQISSCDYGVWINNSNNVKLIGVDLESAYNITPTMWNNSVAIKLQGAGASQDLLLGNRIEGWKTGIYISNLSYPPYIIGGTNTRTTNKTTYEAVNTLGYNQIGDESSNGISTMFSYMNIRSRLNVSGDLKLYGGKAYLYDSTNTYHFDVYGTATEGALDTNTNDIILRGTNTTDIYGTIYILQPAGRMTVKIFNSSGGNSLNIWANDSTGIIEYSTGGKVNIANMSTTDFQIQANTTARVCSVANAGSIYYNSVTKVHYGCNTTTWNALY